MAWSSSGRNQSGGRSSSGRNQSWGRSSWGRSSRGRAFSGGAAAQRPNPVVGAAIWGAVTGGGGVQRAGVRRAPGVSADQGPRRGRAGVPAWAAAQPPGRRAEDEGGHADPEHSAQQAQFVQREGE